jgi:hypothetical protein
VRAGQALFLPSGALVSWHAVVEAADGKVTPLPHSRGADVSDAQRLPIVVEHCFVDASNLNRVVSLLSTTALASASDSDFLALLQSPHLDTTVSRRPPVLRAPIV